MLNMDSYCHNNLGNIWIKTITESVSTNALNTACTLNTTLSLTSQNQNVIYKAGGF